MEIVEKMPVRLKVASIIRKAILSGEFADGEALSLTDTANRLKVSRTPVREAFQLLESEGLIELRMNREAVVHKIDADFIRDHFDMRVLLEGEAIARATANRDVVQQLRTLQDSVPRGDGADLSAVYDTYNHDFHHRIWEGAGSKKLYAFLESLWNGPSYSRTRGSTVNHSLSVEEHNTMLVRMEQGDAEGAKAMMREHILRSRDIILESLTLQ
ncbi:MAG: GntR family transcriptional regulator [Planctomycetes bacterium]|nr:GntR family transcriptional regulator [Planctomycetota bacterium]